MADKDKEHPMVQIQNIQLESFEKAVYARQYEEASALMLDFVRKLKAGAVYIGYQTDPATMLALNTRMCAAMFSLLADPNYLLSPEGYDILASEHDIIDQLFRSSVFTTSDHMLPLISADPAEKDTDKITFTDSVGLAKFMLTYSLRSGFLMNFRSAFGQNPQMMFSLYIGFLTTMLATSKAAEERREDLLGMADIFKGVKLSGQLISSMSDAYMYCSYAHRPDKHHFKAVIHQLYANLMFSNGFTEKRPRHKPKNQKPTALVPVEWFTSLHAMYRCYAPIVRQLRTKFKVIGIGRPHAIDDDAKKEFDGWIQVPEDNLVLSQIIDRIRALNPDVIYYPSIGMDLVWVALASVRIAPLQVMTLGHPASSHSPAIDAVILEAGECGDKSLFTERLVELPEGSLFRFVHRLDADIPEPKIEEKPEVLRIAVPAMVLKLNATFLETLKEIAEKAQRPVEFHFWPNMISTTLHLAAKEIREFLPNAFTYERNAYNNYMRQMQVCHIQLGTFPFGGTNSNIDCWLLGIPTVAMEGWEPHSRVDGKMMRKVGLPEWMITHTRESYVEAALRLIHSDEERVALSQYLANDANIDAKFYAEPADEVKTAFVDAVWNMVKEKK